MTPRSALTETTLLNLKTHLAEAPTREHRTPCPALEAFEEVFQGWKRSTIAVAGIVITIASGAWGALWYQVGAAIERDNLAKVELTELRTRTDERFGAFKGEVLQNQERILDAIAQLPRYTVP